MGGPLVASVLHLLIAFPVPIEWEDGSMCPAVLLSENVHLLLKGKKQSGLQQNTRGTSTWGSSENVNKTLIFCEVPIKDTVMDGGSN